jgi:hypothetical protein
MVRGVQFCNRADCLLDVRGKPWLLPSTASAKGAADDRPEKGERRGHGRLGDDLSWHWYCFLLVRHG